jgi:hypothetical protein
MPAVHVYLKNGRVISFQHGRAIRRTDWLESVHGNQEPTEFDAFEILDAEVSGAGQHLGRVKVSEVAGYWVDRSENGEP